MLKRTDWRSLQWTASVASEPIQLELGFVSSSRDARYDHRHAYKYAQQKRGK
jgi:hypothetical protein